MTSYLVEWKIELEAKSPEAAARTAQKWQRSPDSFTGVFDVTNVDVADNREAVRIDLDKMDDYEKSAIASGWTYDEGGPHWFKPSKTPLHCPGQYAATARDACEQDDAPQFTADPKKAKVMATFPVEIVQVYRATRRIVVGVEAEDLESAVEEQAANDAPAFDDPRWRTGWELQNEDVADAPPGE